MSTATRARGNWPTWFRRWMAAAALTVPLALIVASRIAWAGELPPVVASHWSGPGPADATMPTEALLLGVLVFATVPTLMGVALTAGPTVPRLMVRVALLIAGGVSGVAASQWLVLVGLTIGAPDVLAVVLGPWILLMFGSVAYGLVPMLIFPGAEYP